MYRIVSFGEILWDNLPTGKVPGGSPMNIALHMHALGHQTALISRIGNDIEGEQLMDYLKMLEFSSQFVQKDDKLPTGSVDVVLSGSEGQFYRIAEPVAWDNIQINNDILAAVRDSKMFVYGTLAARSVASRETLFRLLEAANSKVFSVNLRPPHYTWNLIEELLKKADIIKLNLNEFKEILDWFNKGHYLEKDGLEYLRSKFDLDTIIVSLGRRGAMMNRRGEYYERAGVEIEIKDKVGCGNAFLAAYLHARAEKKSPIERLTYAIASGALAAMHPGAANHLTVEMLDQFISKKMTH